MPVIEMSVRLYRKIDGTWTEQWRDVTDESGRASTSVNSSSGPWICRLEFDVDGYFFTLGAIPFYPMISISFRIFNPAQPYCISVLVTPYAYTICKEN
jgi:5-hydroxyisourate hydrolase-like protein (transthyretin family)